MRSSNFFSRRSTSIKFIPEIDGLRFFAILTVVIFHLNTAFAKSIGITVEQSVDFMGGKNSFALGGIISRLDLGVKVFFAISGFILALPFLRAIDNGTKVDVVSYFKRRLTRLEPPFIVSLLVFSIIHIILFHESVSNICVHFLVGLGYCHNLIFGEPNFINPVSWSLETEAQFYILVPLLFFFFKMVRRDALKIAFFFAIFIGSMIFKNATSENGFLNASIFAYFLNFAVGILFAVIYLRNRKYFESSKKLMFDVIGILSVIGMFVFYKPQVNFTNMIVFNISIFLFFLSAFLGKLFNKFFTKRWVYTIGGMCYSIYLLHYAFFHLFVKFSKSLVFSQDYGVNLSIQIVVALPVVLFVSGIFFVLVERPCMNPEWPKLLWMRINSLLKR